MEEEFGAFGNFEEQTSEQPVEENDGFGDFGEFGNFEEEEGGPPNAGVGPMTEDDGFGGFGNFDEEPTP